MTERRLKSVHIADTREAILAQLEVRAEFPNVVLTQSGLANLDSVVWMDEGTLTVVAARPGVGKTVLAAQLARQWGVEGEVWIYITEMSITDWVLRLVSSHAHVSFGRLRKGPSAEDVEAAEKALDELSGLGIRLIECAGWDVDAVIAHAKKGVTELGAPRGIIVDNLGGLTVQGVRQSDRDLWYGSIIRKLHGVRLPASSGGIGCPVVVVHHLNRDGAGGRPAAASLAGSDVIERDADTVLLLHKLREAANDFNSQPYPAGTTHECIVAKNRYGEQCVIPLRFVGEHLRFEDPAGAKPVPYELPAPPSSDATELRRRLRELPRL